MYKYGVSFNCESDNRDFEIGGGGEGDSTIDYVGNDLEKMEAAMVKEAKSFEAEDWSASRTHEFVGKSVNVGGKVVSVIGYPWVEDEPEETYDLCVIYEYDNTGPTVIE